jgi:aminoglycoside phosphotransferase (APT) family kinase protein
MQFASIYKLSQHERTFLERQLLTLQTGRASLPTVFQHGDPGTWNVLITQNGRSAFLDWEASEPQGMPLWDLVYFLRSYCVGAARAQGVADGLAGFEQQFLQTSALSDLVVQSIERYCEAIDLPRAYLEPLFYTCWMHRALKQATRLTGAKLEGGHYLNLLRLCIAQRQSPTLTRLFG